MYFLQKMNDIRNRTNMESTIEKYAQFFQLNKTCRVYGFRK